MTEYWVEVQLEAGADGPRTLPLAWFAYSSQAEEFAARLARLPGVRGCGKGRENGPLTRKWGKYVPAED